MISIALLSEVLKEDINKNILSEFIIGEIYKNYKEDNVTIESISIGVSGKGRDVRKFELEYNIYELMHLCKEWALHQNKSINTLRSYISEKKGSYCLLDITNDKYNKEILTFNASTEPEAVLLACEWIMNNG